MSTAVPSKRLLRPNTPTPGHGLGAWLARRLATSVGNKYVVALTGLVLSLFVLVHMAGNLAVFGGREALNEYAAFLKGKPGLLWLARLFLLAMFLLHLFIALRLRYRSSQARPIAYAYHQNIQASAAARTMVWSGVIILVFTVFHLAHYTLGLIPQQVQVGPDRWQSVNVLELHEVEVSPGVWRPVVPGTDTVVRDPKYRHDVYAMTYFGFHNPIVAILYIIAQLFLLLHLWHGVGSMFQTLGVNWPRTQQAVTWLSRLFALAVAGGNILIVVAVWANLVPPPYGF